MSILNVFRRVWWPHQAMLGRTGHVRGYHDTAYRETTEHLPGLAIYRFDAPILFANARTFRDQVRRIGAIEPRPRWILIAAEPITDVDTTAADMLEDLEDDLEKAGTRLVFAEMKDAVRHKMESYELTRTLTEDHFYPTVHSAVDAYEQAHGAEWAPGPSPYRLD
jgi:MFS superfamily sulfate permease-like transporter